MAQEIDIATPLIMVESRDLDQNTYLKSVGGSCGVIAPARWEGLGLHLFEAIGMGVPMVSLDVPPINEVISHGDNGLLTNSKRIGTLESGVPILEPCVESLEVLFSLLDRNSSFLASFMEMGDRRPGERQWSDTIDQVDQLVRP
jgi:hypothetical protein